MVHRAKMNKFIAFAHETLRKKHFYANMMHVRKVKEWLLEQDRQVDS